MATDKIQGLPHVAAATDAEIAAAAIAPYVQKRLASLIRSRDAVQAELKIIFGIPGIGADWIKRYNKDVYPRDVVIARGHESKPPRYYDKFLQCCDADKLEEVKFSRYTRSKLNVEDSSPESEYNAKTSPPPTYQPQNSRTCKAHTHQQHDQKQKREPY